MNYDSLTKAELIRIAEIDAKTPLELALLALAKSSEPEEIEDDSEELRDELARLVTKLEDISEDVKQLISDMEAV